MQPLVSIGVPVFNGERYLAGALDSLLAQTYPNTQIIVSDNCSTDDTPLILEAYRARFPNLRYSRSETFLDVHFNFQRVLDAATGDYFMWAADDDRWEPTFIAKIMEGLADPRFVTGFCQLDKVNVDSGETAQGFREPPHFAADARLAQNQLLFLQRPCFWMIYGIHKTTAIRAVMSIRSKRDI